MERIREYVAAGSGCKVDRSAGVISGVKVLGLESKNGRSYLPAALEQARPLYEAAKVNVNHPAGNPSASRDYRDRIGALQNVTMRAGEGLFADLHFNPKHPIAEQLIWDAEHAPQSVGLSHNVEATTSRGKGGRVVVEQIVRVQSVDLVADPATTRGLFESRDEVAEKRALCESVASEIGMPKWAIPPLDLGVSYCHTRAEVRDYLKGLLEVYRKNGTVPPAVTDGKSFATAVTTGNTTEAERREFNESLGIPNKPAAKKTGAQSFIERIA